MISLNRGNQLLASVKLQTPLPPRLLDNNLVIINTEMRELTKTKGTLPYQSMVDTWEPEEFYGKELGFFEEKATGSGVRAGGCLSVYIKHF